MPYRWSWRLREFWHRPFRWYEYGQLCRPKFCVKGRIFVSNITLLKEPSPSDFLVFSIMIPRDSRNFLIWAAFDKGVCFGISVSELLEEAADPASERIELAHCRGLSFGTKGRALAGGTRRWGGAVEVLGPGVAWDDGLLGPAVLTSGLVVELFGWDR